MVEAPLVSQAILMNDTDGNMLGCKAGFWTRTLEDHMLKLLRETKNDYTKVCATLQTVYLQNREVLAPEECYSKRQEILLSG